MNLSNCLKLHFERDLFAFGIIANREVQIFPRLENDPAQLVDILVQAMPIQEDGNPGNPVSVIIEVKCSWNPGILKDIERQLFERYLRTNQFDFGIYSAAYFHCPQWKDPSDPRRTSGVGKMRPNTLASRLHKEAQTLSSGMKLVESVVLDCRLMVDVLPKRRSKMRRR